MNEKNPQKLTLVCGDHGEREATFVCSHVAASVRSRELCGFNWLIDEDGNFQSFCDACTDMDEDAWEAAPDKGGRAVHRLLSQAG